MFFNVVRGKGGGGGGGDIWAKGRIFGPKDVISVVCNEIL